MPFGNHARITITNDGSQDVQYLFYQVDYEVYPSASVVADNGRFHPAPRNPTKAIPTEQTHRLHPSGDNNYIFVDATGKDRWSAWS